MLILINSSPGDALGIFQPFLPIFPPIGLGYLSAMADRNGIENVVIDEQVTPDVLSAVERLTAGKPGPHFFGFSVLTAAYQQAIKVSRQIKERYPDSWICFGGAHPTAAAEDVLSYGQVDFVIRGEGENPLIELYRACIGGADYSQIPNLSWRKGQEVVNNPVSSVMMELDQIPAFPYHLFKHPRYDMGFIISSRGCPYNCIFCSNRNTTGKKYRYRDPLAVAAEVEMLYEKFGVRNILFLDDNLLVNKKRVYLLLDELRKRQLHTRVTYSFQARGDNVDRELLGKLYENSFRSVFFGLETASESLMKSLEKGETVAQCVQAVRMAKEAGFHVSATFIYALPGETHKDRMDCLKLSKELGLNMVRYNNATPYPGTKLFEIARQQGRLNVCGIYTNFNSVSTFIENPFHKIPFSYVPPGSSENAIRHDILASYLAFYLDPKRLRTIFAKPERGVGWFNAGKAIADILRKAPAMAYMFAIMFAKFGELFFSVLLRRNTELTLSELVGLLTNRTGPGK